MAVGIAFCLKIACFWSSLLGVLASIEYVEHNVCGSGSEEPSNTCSSGIQGGDVDSIGSGGWMGRSWTFLPMPSRLIVIGDIHGGLEALTDCLVSANLIDEKWNWVGGNDTLVSIGDVFDRGVADLETAEALLELRKGAQTQNGTVLLMLGNHEVLNARGDHRYAHEGAYDTFNQRFSTEVEQWIERNKDILKHSKVPGNFQARIAAMVPGGPVAKMLSNHSTVAIVGDTLFVHGGLRLEHLDDLECDGIGLVACLSRLNYDMSNWLAGGSTAQSEHLIPPMPWEKAIWGRDGMLWARQYSNPPGLDLPHSVVKELEAVLDRMGVSRMVVGHTPQPLHGINSAAGGKVWRIDTGMTPMIGGPREVLEIHSDGDINIISTIKGRIPATERDSGRFGVPVAA